MKYFSNFRKTSLKKAHPSIWVTFTLSFFSLIYVLASNSTVAYAGIASLVQSFFEGKPAAAKVIMVSQKPSSQTIALLQAATNSDPNPNKIPDIAPIADNMLVPDIAATNTGEDDQSSSKISTYIVRPGDTVSSIAKMFKVSVSTVLWTNGLTSKSVLKDGQTLVILPVSGIMYSVKKGDTVESIAKTYQADVQDIISYNDLSVTALIPGQTIIIPDAEIALIQVTKKTNAAKVKKTYIGSEPLLDDISSYPSLPGYFIRPVIGGSRSQGLHGHNAIDLAAPEGTIIRAAAAGTVIVNRVNGSYNGGYGNFVVIAHDNGTQTLYAHMQNKRMVSVGERVSQGQTIGYMGSTGLSTGYHLHFEVREAQNPF